MISLRNQSRVYAALFALALGALALLGLASRAAADTADYPAALYLSSTASTSLTTSYKLISSAGPGTPAATPTAVTTATLGNPSGTYSYLYTTVDATGGETPPSVASSNVTIVSKQITVGNLPTGVTVRIYRLKGAIGTAVYTRIVELVNNASATYVDNTTDAAAAALPTLPQAQARVKSAGSAACPAGPPLSCGYADFSPLGFAPASTESTLSAAPAINGKGWIVDGAGGVTFAAGAWTVTVRVSSNALNPNFGAVSHLAVGIWKVTTATDSSAITGSTLVLDPAVAVASNGGESATNLITTTNSTQTITLAPSLGSISLAANEHLYVQFFRRQTVSYTNGTFATRLITMNAFDGTGRIAPPTVSGTPTAPTLQSPAAGAYATPSQLSATFSDPDVADTGSVNFRVCTVAATAGSQCTGLVSSGSSATVANGASASWAPTGLVHGTTYYWQAQGNDAVGLSAWTATRSFVDDTVASNPTLAGPADGSVAGSPTLAASFADPDTGDIGTVNFRVCTAAAAAGAQCATLVTSGASASVANGATGSWAPSSGLLTPGTAYSWQAQAQDASGGQSGWTATHSFTYTPADASLGLADGAFAAPAQLSATFSDPVAASRTVNFRVCTVAASAGTPCSDPVTSGTSASVASGATATWAPTGLVHGTRYYWQAQSQDTYNGLSSWSATRSFVQDTVASEPTLAGVVDGAFSASPTLGASFADPDASETGTVNFRLCTAPAAAGAQCAALVTSGASASVANGGTGSWAPGGLAHGTTYYWQAQGQDSFGGQSGWTATRSFVADTVADAPVLAGLTDGSSTAVPTLAASFADPDAGDTGTVNFRVCTDAAAAGAQCATLATSGASASAASGAIASWAPTGLLHGTTYYWQAQAQDSFNGQSAWSATSSVRFDAPPNGAEPLSPAAADVLKSAQLTAAFSDPDGDTGTVEFRLCTDAAAGGAQCGNAIAGGSSGAASGSTASWAPSGLVHGTTYYWQVLAQDSYGSRSGWTDTRSFTIDTPPSTPLPTAPADSTFAKAIQLVAGYSDADGDTGTIDFQLCSQPAAAGASCDGVVGAGTAAASSGSGATWRPSSPPADGKYYWQARATDSVGATSLWSATQTVTLDTLAPRAPATLSGTIAGQRFTLRWTPPSADDAIAWYILYVDGKSSETFPATVLQSVSDSDSADGHTFALLAVDKAGNIGPLTSTLVDVPALVGLTVRQAQTLLASRGLKLTPPLATADGLIVEQTPGASALLVKGSSVSIGIAAVAPPAAAGGDRTLAAVIAGPPRLSAAPRKPVNLKLTLGAATTVTMRLLGPTGQVLGTRSLGPLRSGANQLAIKLPAGMNAPGRYVVVLSVGSGKSATRLTIRLDVRKA